MHYYDSQKFLNQNQKTSCGSENEVPTSVAPIHHNELEAGLSVPETQQNYKERKS